jgi:hypothetical protein
MRDIKKRQTRATIERAWTLNNSTASIKACPKNLRADSRPLNASYKFKIPNMKWLISELLTTTIVTITLVFQKSIVTGALAGT